MTTMDKWSRRYFLLAMHVASWSKDPKTKVGAVAVGLNNGELTVGYNGFPQGIEDKPSRYSDRPTKYLFTQHAERNVLDNANFSLRGGTLATTMFPCIECTKSIISKGVAHLITPPMPEPLPDGEKSWRDDCPIALGMLQEKGVRLTFICEALD